MSLLLDALKKAAEQKAEKNRQESAGAGTSDETVVDAAAEDASELESGNLRQTQSGLKDETEFDDSDYGTRLERSREDGFETRLDLTDPTETRPPSAQAQTGEDETLIFADEDVADFMGDPSYVSREPRAGDDETELGQDADETFADDTDLSQLAHREDETEISRVAAEAYGDETELSQLAHREDDTDVSRIAAEAYGDETELSQLVHREDDTDVSRIAVEAYGDESDLSQLADRDEDTDVSRIAAEAHGDETDLSQLLARDEAGTGAGTGAEVADDETDISVPPRLVADLEHAEAERAAAAEETGMSEAAEPAEDATGDDEDMSLLLVERDQTNLTSPTSVTDPQRPADQIQALQADAAGTEELALVDTTQHRLPSEAEDGATRSSATATTGVNQDTQTTRSASTRTETSTRTYAPDNYDRTLMRLPSDDASKLFAGMKADSDVVMTPEYAKKVFQSKSSAARMQQYKIYGGIGFAILLVIAVFGLFEFQAEQDGIDNSLRPLKRDPMPGLIRPEREARPESLFAEVEVDEKTLSLLETVTNDEAGAADEPSADDVDEVAAEDAGLSGDASAAIEQTAVAETQTAGGESSAGGQPAQAAAASSPAEAAMTSGATPSPSPSQARDASGVAADTRPAARPATAASSSSLQISSSQGFEQKNVWLREAYAAYQAGNDEQALRLYNQVLAVDPVNRNALLARAAINVHNNNAAGAIRDYQKLLLANPRDSLALTSLIAVANYSPRETETQLKLMLRDDPDSPYLNFALANAYSAQDRWQEAQGHYFAALRNNPDDPNYAYNLAVSLEHISQPRAAVTYYRRALENMSKGLATFNKDVVDQRLEVLGKP